MDALLRAYYRHVAPEDVGDRSAVDVYGAFASHYQLAEQPAAGHRPGAGVHARRRASTAGPPTGHSVVEVVVDDMPFLVDSLTMELSRQLRDVHLVIHPLLRRRP